MYRYVAYSLFGTLKPMLDESEENKELTRVYSGL